MFPPSVLPSLPEASLTAEPSRRWGSLVFDWQPSKECTERGCRVKVKGQAPMEKGDQLEGLANEAQWFVGRAKKKEDNTLKMKQWGDIDHLEQEQLPVATVPERSLSKWEQHWVYSVWQLTLSSHISSVRNVGMKLDHALKCWSRALLEPERSRKSHSCFCYLLFGLL